MNAPGGKQKGLRVLFLASPKLCRKPCLLFRLCVVLVEVAKEQRRHCLRCLNLRETCHDNLGIRLVFCGTVEFSGGIAAARTSHLTKMVPAPCRNKRWESNEEKLKKGSFKAIEMCKGSFDTGGCM